jgi:hypothetical protein
MNEKGKITASVTVTNTGNYDADEIVPGFASNHIWSAIDGGNGLLYIGHVDRGFSILSIKDKTVKNFTHEPQSPNSLPGNEVTCVYKDKSGNIWIGTDRGVVLFNPEAESFIPFDDKTNCISYRVYDISKPRPVPFLVLISITPEAPREPYIAVSVAFFKIVKLSMSAGYMVDSVAMSDVTPSIITNGSLPPIMDVVPRTRILFSIASLSVPLVVTFTPAD